MVGEACLPSNAYYPWTPDYTLCSGVHVCWSEHSDSLFVYGFMSLDYGFGTLTGTTYKQLCCFAFHHLFIVSSSFDAKGLLCFVIVVSPKYHYILSTFSLSRLHICAI